MNHPNLKELRVCVESGFHKEFKTIASSMGLSLKDAVIQAVALWVQVKSKELGVRRK
jgi:hypothetical protein